MYLAVKADLANLPAQGYSHSAKPSGLLPHLETPQYKSFAGTLMVRLSPKDVEPLMRPSVPGMCECECLFTL